MPTDSWSLTVLFVLVLSSVLDFCSHFGNSTPINRRTKMSGQISTQDTSWELQFEKTSGLLLIVLILFPFLFILFRFSAFVLFRRMQYGGRHVASCDRWRNHAKQWQKQPLLEQEQVTQMGFLTCLVLLEKIGVWMHFPRNLENSHPCNGLSPKNIRLSRRGYHPAVGCLADGQGRGSKEAKH